MDTHNDLPEELAADARRRWLALTDAAALADVPLPVDDTTARVLERVLALSDFVFSACTRNPAVLADLLASGDLASVYAAGAYDRMVAEALSRVPLPAPEETFPGPAIQRALRRVRLREMVRIAVRDLSGWADLDATLADLSAFADACLDGTLEAVYPWHCLDMGTPMDSRGRPRRMVVFAMGKLGARELNFSSDIDLVFAFPGVGETVGGKKSVTHADFFSRLGRLLIKMLGETTPEGRVFRVDMGLRPFGESGPLALSFDAMESYYQTQGREWERYAWIKARVVAGDKAAGARLLENLRPFVFRRYLDYGVFDALREMKQKIAQEVKKKAMAGNVKLGAGGIREIEFFGQMFQLIRGGVVTELRTRGIQEVLGILAQRRFIPEAVRGQMLAAYVFLRKTENRLQAFSDRQTHDLPKVPDQRIRLAAAMGFGDWETFNSDLDGHMAAVHGHFNRLLESAEGANPKPDANADLLEIWLGASETDAVSRRLAALGFPDPKGAVDLLANLRNAPATRALSMEGRKRLDALMPQLIRTAGGSENPFRVLNRLVDLVKTIERRTSYLALLLENPSCLTHLAQFADASPWIIGFIAQHPVLLDELLDPRALFRPPEKEDLRRDAAARLAPVPLEDLELFIEELCIFKQVNTLRVAAADVAGHLPLMKVSDRLSWIAETILDRVMDFAWKELVRKHGLPDGVPGAEPRAAGFAVAAYGKLGGLELGYASDLDLVFLHAGGAGLTSGGDRPIDTTQLFTRLGQRMVHILTAHTRAGRLYETDMRLRPSGSSGPLVSQIDAFDAYQTEASWTWENQAIVRARAVCGDPDLMERFERIRGRVIARKRDRDQLRREVSDMRERLRKEHQAKAGLDPGVFHLKQGPGGMVDIEFLAQFLVLLHAHAHEKALTRWSDNVRILESLTDTGIVDNPTAHLLKRAYLTYRATGHRLSLRDKPPRISGERFADLRKGVRDAWRLYLGC